MSSLTNHRLSELLAENGNGLRLYAETAWGWAPLKITPFLRMVAAKNGNTGDPVIMGFSEIRNDGGLTLKIPNRA